MLCKCYTQYVSKFGKLSSGLRTGKGQFSFQSKRRSMLKNLQTTTQWRLFCMLIIFTCVLSHVRFFAILWTVAHQATLFIEFFRQEYWDGLPFPSPGDLPESGIEMVSPASLVLAGEFFYH